MYTKHKQRIKNWLFSNTSLCIGVALLVAILTLNMKLLRVEAYIYDLRVRLLAEETIDPRIFLLVLGGQTEIGGKSNYQQGNSLESHLTILEKLVREKPAAIAYLNKFDPLEIESSPQLAEKFVSIASQAQNQGTRIYFGTDVDLSGELLPPYPLSLLPHAASFLYKDGEIFGEDKVVRRALLTANDEPTIYMRLAFPELSREQLLEKAAHISGAYYFNPAKVWHMLIRYPANTEIENRKFPFAYSEEILQEKNKTELSGKIILIDSIRKDVISDFVFTPYSHITYAHPRLFVQAAILNTLLKDNGTAMVSWKVDVFLTILLSFILSYVTMLYSPIKSVACLIFLTTGLFISSLLIFKYGDLWLRLVHPMSAMFFSYYLIVPYRAILEYKKHGDVMQKHTLHMQVEEVKGNFLSLMSHDLKTPVARIQGLAELVLKQGGLQEAQENEMRQIILSTEALDKFITKILNLTKVESQEIKLNRKSKDLNKIIEQCVNKLSFQANQKHVLMELKLEPLFPLQIDAALLIQVFTNIIDNAIKYSPEGGCVEIQSREIGDQVEIQIRDYGPGLHPEELQQLFTKFFRGKSHPGDPSKGSGLGLYLAKYFIELHKGSVSVISKIGGGSTFTVLLPIHSVS